MNWFIAVPLLTAAGALAMKLTGKDISWLWVMLPVIGLVISMAGVVAIASLSFLPSILGKLQFIATFLAMPATTLALIIKMARIAL